jgi:dTDP-4-amino-4,6-dideoxy-D-glucose acyltransferase
MSGSSGQVEIASIGVGSSVHRTVEVFGGEYVRVGTNVRIDCFSVITAGPGVVEVGDWAHLSAGSMIFGTAGVSVAAGAALSSRVAVYSTTDDFYGGHFSNPQFPDHLRSVQAAPVVIERHALVGAGAVVLPGVRLGYGCAVGALSLVKEDVPAHAVVAGTPARLIGRRDADQLTRCEAEFAALQAG